MNEKKAIHLATINDLERLRVSPLHGPELFDEDHIAVFRAKVQTKQESFERDNLLITASRIPQGNKRPIDQNSSQSQNKKPRADSKPYKPYKPNQEKKGGKERVSFPKTNPKKKFQKTWGCGKGGRGGQSR